MKNIHIIPTDKSSRLFKHNNAFFIEKEFYESTPKVISQNIYITSDEKPKKGDWVFNETSKEVYKITNVDELVIYEKKIILTTDFKLASDVQKIDDEFLEWFVKNPSCEYVEIHKEKQHIGEEIDESYPKGFFDYKIIIPQEEPKQEPCDNCNNDVCCCNIKRQETLEEFIKEVLEGVFFSNNAEYRKAERLIELGAKWQSKRMYSEGEILEILYKHTEDLLAGKKVTLEEWFENNKKK